MSSRRACRCPLGEGLGRQAAAVAPTGGQQWWQLCFRPGLFEPLELPLGLALSVCLSTSPTKLLIPSRPRRPFWRETGFCLPRVAPPPLQTQLRLQAVTLVPPLHLQGREGVATEHGRERRWLE